MAENDPEQQEQSTQKPARKRWRPASPSPQRQESSISPPDGESRKAIQAMHQDLGAKLDQVIALLEQVATQGRDVH